MNRTSFVAYLPQALGHWPEHRCHSLSTISKEKRLDGHSLFSQMQRTALQEPTQPNGGVQRVVLPRLIVADAALALVDRWKTELAVLRRRSPSSDLVQLLGDCIQELVDAVASGHDLTVQLTISEAHAISHIPVSTLRWLCKHKPDALGARKQEGSWYVDSGKFEAYIASPEGKESIPKTQTAHAIVLPVSPNGALRDGSSEHEPRLKAL